MPLMRPPPTFMGSYNGLAVDAVSTPDILVNVLQRDVYALAVKGWVLHADTTLTVVSATLEGEE